jgi:hypothetical protein
MRFVECDNYEWTILPARDAVKYLWYNVRVLQFSKVWSYFIIDDEYLIINMITNLVIDSKIDSLTVELDSQQRKTFDISDIIYQVNMMW